MTHYQEKKNQSIETDPEITEMTELADKNVNKAIINVINIVKDIREKITKTEKWKNT